jgi:hypothetical protein
MSEASKSGYGQAISEKSWVSLGLVITFVGFAFWMGVQHSQLSELNGFMRGIVADHETRIRVLEKKP